MIGRISALAAMAAAVAWTYVPAAGFAFLNWDDQSVILRNPSLAFPGVAKWALTTTYMEHYQPLSWLAWAAIKSGFGLDATAFHVASIAAHAVCVLLVYATALVVLPRTAPQASAALRHGAAVAAALFFGLHPLRVEVVAWISALPYALALAFLLASFLAYLRTAARTPVRLPVTALMLYAASLAARPVALGFPLVLVMIDLWLLKRRPRASLSTVWPFAVLAVAAAGIESVARTPGVNDAPWLYRLQSAAAAPFVYLWHTIAPVSLTPLDVLPADPVASPGIIVTALLALAGDVPRGVELARIDGRRLAASWAAYLALLAPAAGLVPSGLQATADRYTYLPGVVVAIAVAVAGARWAAARKARIISAAVVAIGPPDRLGVDSAERRSCRGQIRWRCGHASLPWIPGTMWGCTTSERRWRKPVGTTKPRPAIAKCSRCSPAMRTRERTWIDSMPRGSNVRGTGWPRRGELVTASERYRQAIALDPRRTHSQAGLGMALATLGRVAEALPALREAVRLGTDDPAVPNALGVLLLQSGQSREARTVFETAMADASGRCRPRAQSGTPAGHGWRRSERRGTGLAAGQRRRRGHGRPRSSSHGDAGGGARTERSAGRGDHGQRQGSGAGHGPRRSRSRRTDHCPGPSVSATRAVVVWARTGTWRRPSAGAAG